MSEEFKNELENEIIHSKADWAKGMGYRLNDIAIREIFSIRHEVNSLRDDKGMPISGTGRVITNEEKKMVFDFILENNYPLTKKIYNLILRGYINGEVDLVKEETKGMRV